MTWYTEYLLSDHWARVRAIAVYWAGGRCQICDSTDRCEAHHRTYERLGAEAPADVTVLCRVCHGTFHRRLPEIPERDPRDGPEITELKKPRKVFGYDD